MLDFIISIYNSGWISCFTKCSILDIKRNRQNIKNKKNQNKNNVQDDRSE